MKKFGLIFSVLVLALAFSVGSAKAQNTSKMRVNIPFEFSFGGKVYAAGHYTVLVRSNSDSSAVVSLTDDAGKDLQSLIATNANRSAPANPELLFDRANGQVSLTGVALENNGYNFLRSTPNDATYTKNRRSRKDKGKSKSS